MTRPSSVLSGQSNSLAHGCLFPLCCLIVCAIIGINRKLGSFKLKQMSWRYVPVSKKATVLFASLTNFIMPHYEDEPKIDTSATTGDWRESLFRDGFVVVKGVLSSQKAQHYRERMFQWLETFPYGFKADDAETWGKEHLPEHMK